jgi:hypothetical protein
LIPVLVHILAVSGKKLEKIGVFFRRDGTFRRVKPRKLVDVKVDSHFCL